MKNQNLATKVFVFSLLATLIFGSIAGYSVNKIKDDANLVNEIKLALEKRYPGKKFTIGLNFGSDDHKNTFYITATDSATYPANVDIIVVKAINAKINVTRAVSDKVSISAVGDSGEPSGDQKLLSVEASESELEIHQNDDQGAVSAINIVIPKNFSRELQIKTISGDIYIDAELLSSVSLKTISGRIQVNNVQAGAKIESVSGDVIVGVKPNSDEYNVKTSTLSGVVKMSIASNSAANKELSIKTVSGDITIK